MSNVYRVSITMDGTEDSTEIEAENPLRAVFLAGATLGGVTAVGSKIARIVFDTMGPEAIMSNIAQVIGEEVTDLRVEEL